MAHEQKPKRTMLDHKLLYYRLINFASIKPHQHTFTNSNNRK